MPKAPWNRLVPRNKCAQVEQVEQSGTVTIVNKISFIEILAMFYQKSTDSACSSC
ncbi:hypothetical protein MuYL_0648 [Mucilaginibacter xinganensis]|uniref:Uncharacterized protein n=1 Tax=Mucilaginibacter xinganensis TaxID=1234841 RepID=A0A223NSR3_9SPHI|nr:hypothetical protein MuYL_0648 [Mucilaginibacter xinganensis]